MLGRWAYCFKFSSLFTPRTNAVQEPDTSTTTSEHGTTATTRISTPARRELRREKTEATSRLAARRKPPSCGNNVFHFCNAALPRNTAAVVFCSLFPMDNRLKMPAPFEPFGRTSGGNKKPQNKNLSPTHAAQPGPPSSCPPASCTTDSPVPKKHG